MDTGMAILIVSVLSLSLSASLMYICFLRAKIAKLEADVTAANQTAQAYFKSASYYMASSDRLRGHVLWLTGEISESPIAARAQRYGFRLLD